MDFQKHFPRSVTVANPYGKKSCGLCSNEVVIVALQSHVLASNDCEVVEDEGSYGDIVRTVTWLAVMLKLKVSIGRYILASVIFIADAFPFAAQHHLHMLDLHVPTIYSLSTAMLEILGVITTSSHDDHNR